MGSYLLGCHWTNISASASDYNLFARSNFAAVKLRWHHSLEEITVLRSIRPGVDVAVLLPNLPTPTNMANLPMRYARECRDYIRRFYPHTRTFQVGNEPQYPWGQVSGGPWTWQFYLREAIEHLRHLLAQENMVGAELVAPALSFSPALWQLGGDNPTNSTLDEWLAAMKFTGEAAKPVASIWSLFDSVSANCYWQSARQMKDPSFGGNFQRIHAESGGKRVHIYEAGDSLIDRKPPPSLREINEAQAREYPLYAKWARGFDYVADVHFFLTGGSSDWLGFRLTEEIIDALKGA